MDLRQLEMFRTVAEAGGFTRAGEKLHVSHSAVSRQIKLLEDELGSPLFTRASKQVSLTEAGRVLLAFATAIFDQLQKATQSVSELSRNAMLRVKVGTGTTMLNFFLPPILEKFRRRYPNASVLIKTGHTDFVIADLREGVLDLAIAVLPVEGREFMVQPLYQEELVVVMSDRHPLSGRRSVTPQELKDFPFVVFSKGSSTRRVLDSFFREIDISPLVQLELENDEAVERTIGEGIAISFLPKQRAQRDKIRFLRIAGHRLFRRIGLVQVPSHRSPEPEHIRYFTALCVEHAHTLSSIKRSSLSA